VFRLKTGELLHPKTVTDQTGRVLGDTLALTRPGERQYEQLARIAEPHPNEETPEFQRWLSQIRSHTQGA
jgi:hypothetical protein